MEVGSWKSWKLRQTKQVEYLHVIRLREKRHHSVSDGGKQSHILLPKWLKSGTTLHYMQIICNSSM